MVSTVLCLGFEDFWGSVYDSAQMMSVQSRSENSVRGCSVHIGKIGFRHGFGTEGIGWDGLAYAFMEVHGLFSILDRILRGFCLATIVHFINSTRTISIIYNNHVSHNSTSTSTLRSLMWYLSPSCSV